MNDQEYLQQAGITETNDTATPPTPETAQAPAPNVEMFEVQGNKYPVTTEFQITHNGNPQKVPYSTLANTYRQFAHFQDKYKAWKEETEPKLRDFDKYKGFHDKYGQLQEWSEKNPQEWNTLWDLYQNRHKNLLQAQVGADGQDSNAQFKPFIDKIAALEEKFQGLSKYAEKYDSFEQTRQTEADTKFILSQKEEFQKEFPEISLEEKDPDGSTLWSKIMSWGLANGYPEFTPAAHMYLKPRISETILQRGRNEAMKGLKADHQGGIVKRSATPITGQGAKPTLDIRKASYGELSNLAKEMALSG